MQSMHGNLDECQPRSAVSMWCLCVCSQTLLQITSSGNIEMHTHTSHLHSALNWVQCAWPGCLIYYTLLQPAWLSNYLGTSQRRHYIRKSHLPSSWQWRPALSKPGEGQLHCPVCPCAACCTFLEWATLTLALHCKGSNQTWRSGRSWVPGTTSTRGNSGHGEATAI